MIVALFLLWLFFNLLDIGISGLALHLGGAREVGLLFLIFQDFQLMCLIKGAAALSFGMVLVFYNKRGLLAISCGLYFLLCTWNGMVLVRSTGLG